LSLAQKRAGAARPDEPILASMVLSMLATPFIIMHAHNHRHEAGQQRMATASQMTTIAAKSISVDKHVIICGLR
jgi:CPA2 family monovalent cation:H+ antiporter-2